jgi:YHS domain-containing protein
MNKYMFITLLVVGSFGFQGIIKAAEEVAAPAKAVEVGNKVCPVSGEKIEEGAMGGPVQYEYNGKIYNLCCAMCVKDFKKDPEKYSKIADDEVAKEKAQ